VLAGVEDEMDGVEGGVLMLMAPCRDPLGELEVSMGEGMLYLQMEMDIVSGTHSHVFREFKWRTFCARGEPIRIHRLPLAGQVILAVLAGQHAIAV